MFAVELLQASGWPASAEVFMGVITSIIDGVVAICPNKSNKTINRIATDAPWVF